MNIDSPSFERLADVRRRLSASLEQAGWLLPADLARDVLAELNLALGDTATAEEEP